MLDDLFRLAAMSKLQETVVELGVCPKCHSKTLEEKHADEHFRACQCSDCLHVWMLPHNTQANPSREAASG